MNTNTVSRCAAVMDLIDAYVERQTSDNRHAIRFALMALASAPAQPVAMTDERAAFEDAYRKTFPNLTNAVSDAGIFERHATESDTYAHTLPLVGWGMWQARAALSAQPEAKAQAVPVADALREIGEWDHRGDSVAEAYDEKHGFGAYMALIEDAMLAAAPQPPAQSEPLSALKMADTPSRVNLGISAARKLWEDMGSAPSEQRKPDAGFPVLCQAWGETEVQAAKIANTRSEVRQFCVDEWLGEDGDEADEQMELFDDPAQWEGDTLSFIFEIGGMSFTRCYESGIRSTGGDHE